jgi:hypothetical protein
MPVVSRKTSESDQNYTKDNRINKLHDSEGNDHTIDSSTIVLQDADPVVDDKNKKETAGRRSLPETSTTTKVDEKGRSRRSLDSLLSSQKKDTKNFGNGDIPIKVSSTRNSQNQRRLKSGKSSSLFRSRTNSSASWTPPQQDIEGTFLNHSVTVAPILPPVLIHDNDDDCDVIRLTDRRAKHINDDDDSTDDAYESSRIRRELKSKYPVLFDKGVPKESSCIAPPFSANSQISSGASSTSSSKHKSNQPQHQLSQLPTWSPLYNPPIFFEDDYDRENGHLDMSTTMPVTRRITAMAVRKPDHDYLVLGDSVGFVTIYSLAKDNINLPIAQLESVACQQRGKAEQDRLRADLLKRKKQARGGAKGSSKSFSFRNSYTSGFFSNTTGTRPGTPNETQAAFASGPSQVRSIMIDTSDTTIHALGMIQNRVVLATSEELECMDIPSGTSLWVCPLSSNRFVTSLDMHLSTFDVLVSCSKTTDSTEAVAAPISPLMLLQHSKNNVEICDANSPMLVRSPSCTAIWDIGAQNRLLFIALSSNRQEHELVLVSGGSIDSWKVACKTKIPSKTSSAASAPPLKLSQSPGGVYTLVASSRGIRLYQTESLQLIHVFGDQLALHGQSVMWKDCWLSGSFFSEKNKNIAKAARGLPSQWLQCDDWLGERIEETTNEINNARINDAVEDTKKNQKTPDLAPYIIGVPHTKGPKELCENLHVWKVEHPSVVPMMSIPLPHKAEGALGLVGSGSKSSSSNTGSTEDRIVLVTNNGQSHLLLPKMESNFAGIEYPPGYQVLTDNIEYIEDEEATDHTILDDSRGKDNGGEETEDLEIDLLGHGDDDESMDEELREAMRQSLLEHKKHEVALKHDDYVDILGTDGEKDENFLPCRPEPYLRQMINTVFEGEETSENEIEEKLNFSTSGEASNFNGLDRSESSTAVATKPKLTDAIFISKVLELMPNMPNMPKPKPLEEDCLSFTTTKVVVAVNPVLPTRPGRGRKSRAANLETMLRASINPYLQSMMLSRQGVAVNGQGSTLKIVNNGARTNPEASARINGDPHSSCDSSDAVLNGKRFMSPRQATNDDEAAVVMGLLGLSPCHATNVPSNTFVPSDSKEEEIGISTSNGQQKESAYLNSSSFSLLGVKNEDNQVVSALSSDRGSAVEGSECMSEIASEKSKTGTFSKLCSACRGRHVIHSCGKRSLPIDHEEIARAERERKEKEEEEKKRLRAEKRRLADQKRREARKQKQRELEEQRMREEKERLEEEQRRRLQEDFASQDLNRLRREKIVASYANHIGLDRSPQTQAMNGMHSAEYPQSQQLETPTSSYSNDLRHNAVTQSMDDGYQRTATPQAAASLNRSPQPQIGTSFFDHGTQHVQQATPNASVTTSKPTQSPLSQAALPSVSETLASTDALFALANLAELTQTEPERSSYDSSGRTTSPHYGASSVNQYNVPSFAASHGFSVHATKNETVSSDFGGEVKPGIPSYATIRGQYSNGSPNDVASAMTNTLAATSSFCNGYTHKTDESNEHEQRK